MNGTGEKLIVAVVVVLHCRRADQQRAAGGADSGRVAGQLQVVVQELPHGYRR